MVVSGPSGFASAPLGFSITSGLKSVARGVVKAHVVGTKALVNVARNPNVQRAAVAAGQSYVQSKYADQYARAAGLYSQGKQLLRPPGAPMPPPPPPDAGGDDGGDNMPVSTPGVPAQRGNLMLIGGLVAAGLLVLVLTR